MHHCPLHPESKGRSKQERKFPVAVTPTMACSTSTSRLVLVLVLVLSSAAAAVGGGSVVPGYCAPGQAIPDRPLSGCVWYVASRSCDVAPSMVPVFMEICCHQLEAVPAECRCRALRVMMEAPLVVGAEPGERRRCRAAQARFAPAVVSAAVCGLPTVHGRPFCNDLDDE